MTKIRGFELVSTYNNQELLPKRETAHAAGYDLKVAENTVIAPGEIVLVPTGVKAYMQPGEVLYLYDRSSNPRKKGLVLINSVGVIDSFPLGVITFFLIQFNNIRYNKVGAFTNLFKPLPFLFPINLIGEIAVPFSLSLRLFGNVLSGTVIMALLYGLLSQIAIIWPGFLHAYFDVFSGAIQTYVFCMLTMVFVSDKIPD